MATEVYRTTNSQPEDPAEDVQPKSPRKGNSSLSPPPRIWLGSVRMNKLWCDCEPPRRANCLTSGKRGSKGKRFWTCPKEREDGSRCPLFIWDEEAEEAKAWLLIYGPQEPAAETPKKGESPKERETPWTKAKRKPVSGDTSDLEQNGGPSERKDDGYVFIDEVELGAESPSRKATKRKRVESTGGAEKSFEERLRGVALPTPETMGKGKGKLFEANPLPFNIASPSKDVTNLNHGDGTDSAAVDQSLAAKVLRLLREDRVGIKESTELQIRHEIELEADLNAAKTKRYEETVSRMSKRLDELETIVGHLTGDDEGSMGEPICLSD